MDTEISKVQAPIEAVDKQIRDVESSYKAVLTAEVSSNEAASEKQFLREKLLYLREEKKSLWEKKKKLLELKHQHEQEKEKHEQEKELLGLKSKVVPSGNCCVFSLLFILTNVLFLSMPSLVYMMAKLGGMLPPHLDLDKENFDYWLEATDSKVRHTFLKDLQLWIDGKGHEEEF